jgi:hypothetical protein
VDELFGTHRAGAQNRRLARTGSCPTGVRTESWSVGTTENTFSPLGRSFLAGYAVDSRVDDCIDALPNWQQAVCREVPIWCTPPTPR